MSETLTGEFLMHPVYIVQGCLTIQRLQHSVRVEPVDQRHVQRLRDLEKKNREAIQAVGDVDAVDEWLSIHDPLHQRLRDIEMDWGFLTEE